SARPATRTALSAIGGIGEAKLASFGDELLAIVGAHCAAAVDKPPPQPGAAPVGSDAQ
ncbi:MAG: HRDC domain-containing protein, partial [Deltaproteobacteria bacterium]|nr:HRDC domain-containing protein [Deltaproteobacteria bacterium]